MMPTDAPDPLAASRLRAGLERARRWLVRQGPWGRLMMLGGLLAVLLGGSYLVGRPDRSAEPAWVYDGYHFSHDEAGRVVRALEAKSITALAKQGQVEVRRDQLAEAHACLNKLGLAPASLHDAPTAPGLFTSPAQIEQEELRQRAKKIETALRKLDLAPLVQIFRTPRRGLAPTGSLKVTVFLDVEESQPLPPSLIERIKVVVQNFEPDLVIDDGLWICDSQGTPYWIPGARALQNQSQQRARADEIRAGIEQQLSWRIPGVRVGVHLEVEEVADPPPVPAAPVSPTSASVWINQPPEDVAEPAAPAPSPKPGTSKARVVVWVPSDHYRKQARQILGTASPSPSELSLLVSRTEESIRTAVGLVVGSNELAGLTVERVPVPSPEEPSPTVALEPSPARWRGTTAMLGGGLAALGLFVVALGGRFWFARRPSRPRPTPAARRPRIDVAGVAPAERARELVRLDPAAAGGVLQRWIGLGGPDA